VFNEQRRAVEEPHVHDGALGRAAILAVADGRLGVAAGGSTVHVHVVPVVVAGSLVSDRDEVALAAGVGVDRDLAEALGVTDAPAGIVLEVGAAARLRPREVPSVDLVVVVPDGAGVGLHRREDLAVGVAGHVGDGRSPVGLEGPKLVRARAPALRHRDRRREEDQDG
jgi:hypothetical protein